MEYRLHFGTFGLGLSMGLLLLASACVNNAAAPTPTASPVAGTPTSSAPTPSEAATAVPSPIATSSTLIVGNTGGLGVFIRRTPDGDVIRAWPDGAEMAVVGEDAQAGERKWKNVRDPDGNEGWVATEFLVEP